MSNLGHVSVSQRVQWPMPLDTSQTRGYKVSKYVVGGVSTCKGLKVGYVVEKKWAMILSLTGDFLIFEK